MTQFTRHEWYYTGPTENLFDLSKEELVIFKLLVKEAVG